MKRFKTKVGKHTADCIETDYFEYRDGLFAFGLARGLPHKDNIYFRIKDNDGVHTRYLREDEALALIAGLSRAAWLECGLKDKKKFAK